VPTPELRYRYFFLGWPADLGRQAGRDDDGNDDSGDDILTTNDDVGSPK
jgi:hypothetical protein